MLLILAEANAFNTSGAYNGGGLRPPEGRRPHLGNSLYALLILKALASAGIKSIGHRAARHAGRAWGLVWLSDVWLSDDLAACLAPLVLKALATHLF